MKPQTPRVKAKITNLRWFQGSSLVFFWQLLKQFVQFPSHFLLADPDCRGASHAHTIQWRHAPTCSFSWGWCEMSCRPQGVTIPLHPLNNFIFILWFPPKWHITRHLVDIFLSVWHHSIIIIIIKMMIRIIKIMALPRRHFQSYSSSTWGTNGFTSLSKDGVAKEDHLNIQPHGQAKNRTRDLLASSQRSYQLISKNK